MKKLTIKKAQSAIDSEITKESIIDFCGNELVIKKLISLPEMISFVNSSVDACFSDGSETYIPEVKDFVIKANIIDYYTNISSPEDFNSRYSFVYNLWDLVGEDIVKRINASQINEIQKSINTKIESRLDYINSAENMIKKYSKVFSQFVEDIENSINIDDFLELLKNSINSEGKFNESQLLDAMDKHI